MYQHKMAMVLCTGRRDGRVEVGRVVIPGQEGVGGEEGVLHEEV